MSVSYKTIKVYLAALQFYSRKHGFQLVISDMQRLHYLLRGIQRTQGSSRSRPKRIPVTVPDLYLISRYLRSSHLCPHDQALYWAASTVAFFGLLRVSEYTCPNPQEFDTSVHLQYCDIVFHNNFVVISIKSSKTDPFRQGVKIRIAALNSVLCPVSALRVFLRFRGYDSGPLFRFANGAFLTRANMVWLLQHALNKDNLNTHSFRIGGASAAAAAGCPDSVIQILGRWSSNAFREYLRLDDATLANLARSMCNSHLSTVGWQPDV